MKNKEIKKSVVIDNRVYKLTNKGLRPYPTKKRSGNMSPVLKAHIISPNLN